MEKIGTAHSAFRFQDQQTTEYQQTLATRWGVKPKDVRQIDEEVQPRLVKSPLNEPQL